MLLQRGNAWKRPVATFRQGLNESGYSEGRNVPIDYPWAESHYERLPDILDCQQPPPIGQPTFWTIQIIAIVQAGFVIVGQGPIHRAGHSNSKEPCQG